MLSFTSADHARVASGELTVTWRLWKYPHVKAGHDYSTGFGYVHVDDVRCVRAAEVSDSDALEARLPDVDSLLELAASHTRASIQPDTLLYRVQFRFLSEPPPRPELSIVEVSRRLRRIDSASRRGAWTHRSLRLIEENPGVAAGQLAADMGLATRDFKVNVRKLKALGLTVSLETGYELSMLGQAYLDGSGLLERDDWGGT
jgi:hypothetical protein